MSGNHPNKRVREKAKRERAEEKRAKRETRSQESPDVAAPVSTVAESDVLEALAELHRLHDAGDIAFDDFESRKAELISQLAI